MILTSVFNSVPVLSIIGTGWKVTSPADSMAVENLSVRAP